MLGCALLARRERLKIDTAENMSLLAMVGLVIIAFLFGTMFVTLLLVYAFRPESYKAPPPESSQDKNPLKSTGQGAGAFPYNP